MQHLQLQKTYRHFKGKYYFVQTLARDCDSSQEMVVYQAMYPPFATYVRSLEAFLDEVDPLREDNVCHQKERFKLMEPSSF